MSRSFCVRRRGASSCSLSIAIAIAMTTMAVADAQSVTAPALDAPGKISYDTRGMPTIQAASDNDAAFLQGYAHAQYRFFQMDLTRRQVSGTLAALVGPSQLANDVQARTLGLRRAAERSWAAMSDDTRSWLSAYAAGVNQWLATNPLPPEYGALDLSAAEPWTPVDSVVVGKGLAYQLSFDLDIDATIQLGAYQTAGAAAGFDGTALFFGDLHRSAPADDRVTIPGFQPGSSASSPAPKSAAAAAPGRIDPETLKLAGDFRASIQANPLFAKALAGRDTPVGSNEWVVGGALTASGKPILSNDPHLSLSLPPVFTEQHIVSTDSRYTAPLDVTGVTVPGAPGVIQGCNQKICWGTTTNSLDVTDVFKETLRVDGFGLPVAIVHDGIDEPVQWLFQSYYVNQLDGTPDHVVRDATIGYANGAVTFVVPRRNNGPIVQTDGDSALSIAYTGFGATQEIESFRRINRAANLDQFRDALTYFDFGSQNFAYADTSGNIAYFTSAEAPVRTDLQTAGAPGGGIPPWLIRDGSGALGHDWMPVQNPQPNQATPYEILPADEMPFVINPASGYFANANNDPIGFSLDNDPLNQQRPGGGIYYLDWGGASSFRMGRIDRVIQAFKDSGHKITTADMQALQANTQALDAELLLPYLLAAYDHATADGAPQALAQIAQFPNVVEAIARLRAWDYSTPTGIAQGFDPGDNPLALPAPDQAEQDASVAATLWATWRSDLLRNTIDLTLQQVGLQDYLPGSSNAFTGVKFLLDNFDALQGHSASGLDFFAAFASTSDTPLDAATERDIALLGSLFEAANELTGSDFSAAFGGSTNMADYRWGRLHRIVFDHPLGGPFSIPGQDGQSSPYGYTDLADGLPGIARGGAWETVNVGSYDLRAHDSNGFMFGSGSARRFVGEMTSTIGASEVIPGGNSAVLGSPYYADQLPLWLTNQYHALPIPASAATAASTTTVNFTP